MSGSRAPLRRIGAAWFLANFAEWAYVTVLTIHEYRRHGAIALGLIGARYVLAALLGSLLLSAIPRRDPQRALQGLALARCLSVGAAALAVGLSAPLGVIVAIIWIDAVVGAPYRPIQASILPALAATPRELSAAAGSIPSMKALAQASGALLGSLALGVLRPVEIVGAAVGLFVGAVVLTAQLGVARPAPGRLDVSARRVRVAAVLGGFRLVAGRARPLLLLGGTRSLTRGVWTALTVVVALRLLHLGSAGVGLLMAAAGVGAAVSVPIALQLAGRSKLAAAGAASFALAGVPIVLVGLIDAPAPAIALVAVWGVAFALADSISNALIHRVVEADRLAPTVAALESSKLLLEGLGALIAPGLLAWLGVRDAVIVAGLPLPMMIVFSRRPLRAIDDRAADRGRPLAALRRIPSFRGLTMLALESLAARLHPRAVPAGEVIIRQGEPGDQFYLVDSGRVEVTMDGFPVAALGPGASFGEKALLRDQPRSATVTALEPTALWALDGPDFIAVVTGHEGPVATPSGTADAGSVADVLRAVPLFAAIDGRNLAAEGAVLEADVGEVIVRQGEPGDRFYVLLAGAAEVEVDGRWVRRLVAGDCFGEIALLHDVDRTATVIAAGPLRLWSVERAAFARILGTETGVLI